MLLLMTLRDLKRLLLFNSCVRFTPQTLKPTPLPAAAGPLQDRQESYLPGIYGFWEKKAFTGKDIRTN